MGADVEEQVTEPSVYKILTEFKQGLYSQSALWNIISIRINVAVIVILSW